MDKVNEEIKTYVEKVILPLYKRNDNGHGIEHIKYVIRRSIKFAEEFSNIDINMVYVAAAFHDIGHFIDKDNHETISAKLFYENDEMKHFFKEEERIIIREAIEDHRASLKGEPRGNYGKIISSADRTTNLDSILKRTHSYTLKYHSSYNTEEMISRAYEHIKSKYGNNGYAKNYCYDEEYEQFKIDVERLLENKDEFKKKYMKVNEIKEDTYAKSNSQY